MIYEKPVIIPMDAGHGQIGIESCTPSGGNIGSSQSCEANGGNAIGVWCLANGIGAAKTPNKCMDGI
jgi:hypothetical protein